MKGLSKSRYTAYHNLDGSVHNGGEAMTIYPKIAEMLPNEADAARRSLLEYCKLDTFAMVKVWEKLREAIIWNKTPLPVRQGIVALFAVFGLVEYCLNKSVTKTK